VLSVMIVIDCHRATQSRETSDILMPDKASCARCHSPQGKVVAECITCHNYHAPPQLTANASQGRPGSFKQMLLETKKATP